MTPAHRRTNRGASLATTLMMASLLMVLAFAAAAGSVAHLNVGSSLHNSQAASNRAESAAGRAVAQVVAELAKDSTGSPPYPEAAETGALARLETWNWTAPDPDDEDQWGAAVAFSQEEAGRLGIPSSTANSSPDAGAPGSGGRAVPPRSIQIVGCGRSGGITRAVEVLMTFPRFPYAVASQGSIESDGGLLVASWDQPGELPLTAAGLLDIDQLLPGNMAANGAEGVDLGARSIVTGDLFASGGVAMGEGSVVRGEIRRSGDPITIPALAVTSYDPGTTGVDTSLPSDITGGFDLAGSARRRGDTRIFGGLSMYSGLLYVKGNLTIHGGIQGQGAVVATGNVAIEGQTKIDTTNRLAIVAGGDLAIQGGSTPDSSRIRGLLYAGKNFKLQGITAVGAFLAAGQDGSEGNVTMSQATAIHCPEETEFEVTRSFEWPRRGATSGMGSELCVEVDPDLQPEEFLVGSPPLANQEFVWNEDKARLRYRKQGTATDKPTLTTYVTREQALVDAEEWESLYDQYRRELRNFGLSKEEREVLLHFLEGLDPDARQNLLDEEERVLSFLERQIKAIEADRKAAVEKAAEKVSFKLDLSRFIAPSDRVRILYWRDFDPAEGSTWGRVPPTGIRRGR